MKCSSLLQVGEGWTNLGQATPRTDGQSQYDIYRLDDPTLPAYSSLNQCVTTTTTTTSTTTTDHECPGDGNCSGNGYCDLSTGICVCSIGFVGQLCEGMNEVEF